MKILLINTSEQTGGAGIACNRLMQALNKSGHEAKTLVRDKQTDDKNVISINDSWFRTKINFVRFVWERLIIFLLNGFSRKNLFAISIANTGMDISNHPLVKEADIIHLHWINQGMLSFKNIRQLIQTGKPIVWTLHDMWPITGICHYSKDCRKYTDCCNSCFFLPKNQGEISLDIFKKKLQLYKDSSIHFVGCSQWMANCAKQSALLQTNQVLSIPNPIDINRFKITDKYEARKKFDLPTEKKLILFGALNIADERKGITYLLDGLKNIQSQFPNNYKDMELVVFGQIKSEVKSMIDIKIHSIGYLNDETDVITLYNAIDLFVISSLEDNLPNTVMESMACGIPCIGFDIGGIPEMIDHKETGYVAKYKNAEDLATGIHWTLFSANYAMLSANARKKVILNYAEEIVAEQYEMLYNELKYD